MMFKVGDEVAVITSFRDLVKISKVGRVTHNGKAVWVDGQRYGSDGFQRGGQHLVGVTPEMRDRLRRRDLVHKLCALRAESLKELSLDNLQFAAEMLGLVPVAKKEGEG